jgi:nitrogenase molybdenum-iron protein NifN
MNLIFEVANLMLEHITHHHPDDWPLTPEALRVAASRPVVGTRQSGTEKFTKTNLAEASI